MRALRDATICYALFCPYAGFTLGLGGGVAAIASSEDAWHPALRAVVSFQDNLESSLFFYGRYSKLVSEKNFLSSVVFKTPLPWGSAKAWQASVGGALIITSTTFNATPKSGKMSDVFWSPGMSLGLDWCFLQHGSWRSSISWDGHIFPAGLDILLLATDRLQTLSLSSEWRL